ncbi:MULTISPECIES: FHA domain-containing protein [unclassified Corallococcus]|uniref:FHA domain-containing protein n=1 Tax=unclassified Corallococcus TaxID=2685029 RepID=UPI001A8D6B82|nr:MULTISPECIES: FHA domain-containing protein [unclassified Corallococcus]MBN9685798.1 FHA domain-containing protein [Corallococcus sp. NCSPR001]WAS82760.1 FHA domain-containing protein [Corallococcus sp. NCRR]
MVELLSAHVARYLRNREEFERGLPAGLLLFTPPLGGVTPSDQEEYPIRTVTNAGPPTLGQDEPIVFPVLKSQGNAFGRGITVGRTGNNDVVLDDGSVSRFHAWFSRDAGDTGFLLTDAGSKNGSYVAGGRLLARKPMAVEDGVRLRFGQVEVSFYTAGGFARLLSVRLQP